MPEEQWIFDTVTLANFPAAKATSLLIMRYAGQCIIPQQVHDEIASAAREYPYLGGIEAFLHEAKCTLSMLTSAEHDLFSGLIGHLGKGEAACIAMARVRGLIVVTDDRAARRECDALRIRCTGTIGILRAACRDGQIGVPQADEYLQCMIKNGFYSPVRRISDLS